MIRHYRTINVHTCTVIRMGYTKGGYMRSRP